MRATGGRSRRRTAGLGALVLLLLLPAGVTAQDAHPNDHKIVFFKKPDAETEKRIKDAVNDFFSDNLPSERARGRAVCYESPLWSVPYLVQLVEQRRVKSKPIQRWNAILTLARIVDPRAARTLRIAAERDDNPQVRSFACLALGLHGGSDAVEVLVRALRDKSQDVVTAATLALARIGGDEAENAIQDLLRRSRKDRDRNVGLVGLGLFSSSRTMETARKALRDTSSGVVRRAVLALANAAFGPADERRAELRKLFENPRTDARARAFALIALARFSDYRGASTLLTKALLRDRDGQVVEAAARALQSRGDTRTRKEILAKLKQTVDGDAKLAVRLLLALAEIESRSPSEEGLSYLVGRLGSRGAAVRIYAAIALTRVGEAWVDHAELRARAIRVLRAALAGEGGSRGDEERQTMRRALALLDPENPPSDVPEEWASVWDEDSILETMGESLHDVFLETTNWFVAEELQIHTISDVPVQRRDLASGKERVIADENRPLRDLREWLEEQPYLTADQLPDRGYGD